MKKPLALAALFSVLALPAFGAGLPNSKAAPHYAPPQPAFSWSGFYLGGNAGVSAGNFNTTDQFGVYGIGDRYTADSRGFSGGGQVGYNYQLPGSNYVVGIEADFQGSTLQGSYDNVQTSEGGWQDGAKVNWWGTVRGRAGYAVGNVLPFVTGGLAYGHVTTSGSCWTAGIWPFSCDQSQGSASGTHVGWTAGAGLEYAIARQLTFKVEYLYTDLGSVSTPNNYLDATFGGPISSPGDDMRTSTAFSTLRVGVNYKFDALALPGYRAD
jgi:outer membrane immunogenic protein